MLEVSNKIQLNYKTFQHKPSKQDVYLFYYTKIFYTIFTQIDDSNDHDVDVFDSYNNIHFLFKQPFSNIHCHYKIMIHFSLQIIFGPHPKEAFLNDINHKDSLISFLNFYESLSESLRISGALVWCS